MITTALRRRRGYRPRTGPERSADPTTSSRCSSPGAIARQAAPQRFTVRRCCLPTAARKRMTGSRRQATGSPAVKFASLRRRLRRPGPRSFADKPLDRGNAGHPRTGTRAFSRSHKVIPVLVTGSYRAAGRAAAVYGAAALLADNRAQADDWVPSTSHGITAVRFASLRRRLRRPGPRSFADTPLDRGNAGHPRTGTRAFSRSHKVIPVLVTGSHRAAGRAAAVYGAAVLLAGRCAQSDDRVPSTSHGTTSCEVCITAPTSALAGVSELCRHPAGSRQRRSSNPTLRSKTPRFQTWPHPPAAPPQADH